MRGDAAQVQAAVVVLNDEIRLFLASAFLRLEALPKARFHRNQAEIRFCEDFFARLSAWADPGSVVELAERVAAQHGLNAIDALHVAAAILLEADELVTTEKPTKPIHRVRDVRVVSL
jgi:predicted nucleic acid-binding protein